MRLAFGDTEVIALETLCVDDFGDMVQIVTDYTLDVCRDCLVGASLIKVSYDTMGHVIRY